MLEIGPGMGVLTQFLLQKDSEVFVIEIDRVSSLSKNSLPQLNNHIIEGDFLKLPLNEIFKEPFALIGNFPYNISSQILFKALEYRDIIPEIQECFKKKKLKE